MPRRRDPSKLPSSEIRDDLLFSVKSHPGWGAAHAASTSWSIENLLVRTFDLGCPANLTRGLPQRQYDRLRILYA